MSITLKVKMQGVDVGQINSDEYDALKKNIYRNYRSHLAQLFFVLVGIIKIITKAMMMTPIVSFWTVVFIFMFDENTTIDSVYSSFSDPLAVAEALKILVVVNFTSAFTGTIFFYNPFQNAYKKLIDSELRKRFDFKIPYGAELFVFDPDNL